jgi:hypothetical protein
MSHEIHRVVSFRKVAPYTLHVEFDDGTSQTIDFLPVLKGELFHLLQNPTIFDQVRLDPEVHTLVWPNGADFDPATLHNWPESGPALKTMADNWERAKSALDSARNPPL